MLKVRLDRTDPCRMTNWGLARPAIMPLVSSVYTAIYPHHQRYGQAKHNRLNTLQLHWGTNLVSDRLPINSLAPGRSWCDFKNVIFNLAILIGIFESFYDNVLRWMPRDPTDDKSTLVQVMAWCRQATSHYLNQRWPRSPKPYGVTRPQWVNILQLHWGTNLVSDRLPIKAPQSACFHLSKCWLSTRHNNMKTTQIAKTLGSTSIRHRSDTSLSLLSSYNYLRVSIQTAGSLRLHGGWQTSVNDVH